MDFRFTEDQLALVDLAARVFSGRAPVERVKEVEQTPDRFDRELWSALADAGLLGIALPEQHGGSGLGLTELCLMLEQQGRRVAPVPLLWNALAAMTIAEFGGDGLATTWLPRVAAGQALLTVALSEPGIGDPLLPAVEAVAGDGGVWRLTGEKLSVPAAHVADRVLVTARVAGGDHLVIALVDPAGTGVTAERAEATDRQILTHLRFDAAEVGAGDIVAGADRGSAAVRWLYDRALTGLAALQLGVAEEALTHAAAYTSARLQFGKPLSSFQSTSARAADAYIDREAMRATLWQAAWRIDMGRDATVEVEVAKWWASEAGQRVVHAVQHMHGGMGADVDYPVHRYFLWGKQIEDTLGGGSSHLAKIGAALAEAR